MPTSTNVTGRSFIFLLLLVGAAHFCVDTMLGIWPIYKTMVSLDMAVAGAIVALGAFIGEGSQLLFGSFSDRGYLKGLLITGLVMATTAAFFSHFTHPLPLFFLYLLTCIGSGCFHPCAASLMGQLRPDARSLVMTLFASFGALGMATSQITFTYLHYTVGMTEFLILPVIAVAFLLLITPFASTTRPTTPSHVATLSDFRDFFKNPSLRCLYISLVANQSILWGTIFILPDALHALGQSSWICSGGGHCAFIMGSAIMMVPGGYLAQLYSARSVMLYGGLAAMGAFYVLLLFGMSSPALVLVTLSFLGATLALMSPLALALGTRLEPTRSGAVSAFLMGLVWCVSEAIGPGGVGFLSHLFSDGAAIKALAILGALFLVHVYAVIGLPEEEPTRVVQAKAD